MKNEKRKVSVCRKAARILERRQGTGCTAPAGRNSLAFPVSWVTMPEHHLPSTAPTQANPPPHFPENKNTPGSPGCLFLQSFPRQSRRGGRPDGICRRSSVGVNRRVSKRQRRNPPPHRGQSPLWKNAVTPAMPSTSPLRRILGGGRLWGNLWFPTTFERSASAAESPPQRSVCEANRGTILTA